MTDKQFYLIIYREINEIFATIFLGHKERDPREYSLGGHEERVPSFEMLLDSCNKVQILVHLDTIV